MEHIGLYEHTCKQCGKKFECRAGYAYKIAEKRGEGYAWFCSYKCIQAYRNQKESSKQRPTIKEKMVLEMLDRNAMLKDIIEMQHISKETVYKIKDKWRA